MKVPDNLLMHIYVDESAVWSGHAGAEIPAQYRAAVAILDAVDPRRRLEGVGFRSILKIENGPCLYIYDLEG